MAGWGRFTARGSPRLRTSRASRACSPSRPTAPARRDVERRDPSSTTREDAMKKVKLQIQELSVESFPTSQVDGQLGTVDANEMAPTPPYKTCPGPTRMTYDCPCTPMA